MLKAGTLGRSLVDVVQAPAALVLWTYLQLLEAEHIERLIARYEQTEVARLTAAAFHDPKQVYEAQDDARRALRRRGGAMQKADVAELRQLAAAVMREIAEAEARDGGGWQRWEPDAALPVS